MDKPAFFLNCLQCSLMYSVYDFAGLSNHKKLCDAMIEPSIKNLSNFASTKVREW